MTAAESRWRAERMQHLLAVEEMERFEALAKVRQEAKSSPWIATKSIATGAYAQSAGGQ